MTHGSLFSGVGGFDLAAEWAGWDNLFNCEIDPFCQKVLKYHFPNSIQYADIKTTDFTIWRGRINVLTGGFPCQPYSLAGKRLGKEDARHLWPEMLRAIREIKPGWVVGENVFGIVNWNGGLVFEEVQADLEAEGYEVQPFILPACAVNAPHKRDRVWFVARYNASYSMCGRQSGKEYRKTKSGWITEKSILPNWENFPTQSPICGGDDGVSYRLDGITLPKWRNESIKALGNAIVPQVAFQIFKAINEYETNKITKL